MTDSKRTSTQAQSNQVLSARIRRRRAKKPRLSADGTPCTVWQARTRILCLVLLAWSLVEIAVGAGFTTLISFGMVDLAALIPGLTFGPTTVVSGVSNLLVSIFGLWGAYNPKRITVFFWAVFLYALLNSWQVASLWSAGQVDPASVVSLAVSLAYAVCAWNVRGQTGYFDNHPKPTDPDAKPAEGDDPLLMLGDAVEKATDELREEARDGAERR